jgi:hypothetical protein
MQSVGGPTVKKCSSGAFQGGARMQGWSAGGGSIPSGYDKQKRRATLTLPDLMQSVGESNPCYQDENLAS